MAKMSLKKEKVWLIFIIIMNWVTGKTLRSLLLVGKKFPSVYHPCFAPDVGDLAEWQLLPFTNAQQEVYIKALIDEPYFKNAHLNLKHCQTVLKQLPIELVGNPLLLNFCLMGLSFLPKGENGLTTRYQIYKAALMEHFKREETKPRINSVSLQGKMTTCRVLYLRDGANDVVKGEKTLSSKEWVLSLFPESSRLFAEKYSENKQQLTAEESNHCLLITRVKKIM